MKTQLFQQERSAFTQLVFFISFQKEKNTRLSNLFYIWYNIQKRKLGIYEFSCDIPAISCDKLELLRPIEAEWYQYPGNRLCTV